MRPSTTVIRLNTNQHDRHTIKHESLRCPYDYKNKHDLHTTEQDLHTTYLCLFWSLSHVMGSSDRMTNVWISCSGVWESYERRMKVVLNRVKTYEGPMSFFPRSATRSSYDWTRSSYDWTRSSYDWTRLSYDLHTTFIGLNTTFQLGLNRVLTFCIAKI